MDLELCLEMEENLQEKLKRPDLTDRERSETEDDLYRYRLQIERFKRGNA